MGHIQINTYQECCFKQRSSVVLVIINKYTFLYQQYTYTCPFFTKFLRFQVWSSYSVATKSLVCLLYLIKYSRCRMKVFTHVLFKIWPTDYERLSSDVIKYLFTNILLNHSAYNIYLNYFCMDFDQTKTRKKQR